MDFDQESEEIKRLIEQSRNSDGDEDYKRRVRMGGDLLSLLNNPSAAEINSGVKLAKPDYQGQAENVIKGMENPLEKAAKIASTLSAYQNAQKSMAESEKTRAEAAADLREVSPADREAYKGYGHVVAPGTTYAQAKKSLPPLKDLALAGAKRAAEQPGKDDEYASGLRKERSGLPTTKDTQNVVGAYSKILKTATVPSAAGDMSLIYNYMKMLDPGSTVREGEFANAQNAGSVPDRIQAQYNKILNGERLSSDQRSDFLNQSKNVYESQIKNQELADSKYKSLAKKRGVDPEDVIVDFYEKPQAEVPGAASDPVKKKSVVRKQQNRAQNKTKLTYSDGSVEVVDGLN